MNQQEQEFYKKVSASFKEARYKHGYSLDDLVIPGTSRSSINAFENGKQRMGTWQLLVMAKMYGVELPEVEIPEQIQEHAVKRADIKRQIKALRESL